MHAVGSREPELRLCARGWQALRWGGPLRQAGSGGQAPAPPSPPWVRQPSSGGGSGAISHGSTIYLLHSLDSRKDEWSRVRG